MLTVAVAATGSGSLRGLAGANRFFSFSASAGPAWYAPTTGEMGALTGVCATDTAGDIGADTVTDRIATRRSPAACGAAGGVRQPARSPARQAAIAGRRRPIAASCAASPRRVEMAVSKEVSQQRYLAQSGHTVGAPSKDCFIIPPMATMRPSSTCTTLSVSETALDASGSVSFPACQRCS